MATYNTKQIAIPESKSMGGAKAWHMQFGYMVPMVTKAICQLRVPDILADSREPLTATQIVSRIPEIKSNGRDVADAAEGLGRLMHFLSGHGIFEAHVSPSDSTPRYSHDPELSPLLVETNTSSYNIRTFIMLNVYPSVLATFQHLAEFVTRGVHPCERANGMSMYELTNEDPEAGLLFDASMSGMSRAFMNALVESYTGFHGFSGTVVDVAGGIGSNAAQIAAQYPAIARAVNFDLPHVVANGPTYPRVEHVGGDMFQGVPSGDILMLKWVIHNWDDKSCIKLLKNCHKALLKGGKLLIVDIFFQDLPNDNFHNVRLSLDILMMAHASGKQRTREQLETILSASGFVISKFVNLPNVPDSLVEVYPK